MTAPDMTHVVPQHFINDNSHNNVAVAIVLCQPIMSALINQNPVHVNGDDGFVILLLSSGYLSQVAVVVSLHLQVEDFAVSRYGIGDQMIVEQGLQVKVCNISGEKCGTRHKT